jgi:hypothetical protein
VDLTANMRSISPLIYPDRVYRPGLSLASGSSTLLGIFFRLTFKSDWRSNRGSFRSLGPGRGCGALQPAQKQYPSWSVRFGPLNKPDLPDLTAPCALGVTCGEIIQVRTTAVG